MKKPIDANLDSAYLNVVIGLFLEEMHLSLYQGLSVPEFISVFLGGLFAFLFLK